MSGEWTGELVIQSEGDIVTVRRTMREFSKQMGFGLTDVTRIVTAASELARNVYRYAGKGIMRYGKIEHDNRQGLIIEFADQGPGIADVEQALEVGYSTGEGLGMGLPGTKRLMDEMAVRSEVGRGTTVTVKKWMRR